MAGSYRKIDYRLRPSKCIERKMLAESFRKLSEFGKVDSYRYVGFGSLYFSDFSLFHKLLGFKQMVSIEDTQDSTVQARFEYNRPYNAVEIKFGESQSILPSIPWDIRSIVWLDYDGILNKGVLSDIALVCSKVVSGSMLFVSVNANTPKASNDPAEGGPTSPIEALKKEVEAEKVPPTITNKMLAGWGTANVYRTIIDNQIQETLKERNGILSEGSRIKYEQLFNFHYSDGAKMLTVGGIFFDEAQDHIFSKCGFHHLDFYRQTADPYLIDPPLLTFREMRELERYLPAAAVPAGMSISQNDINKYERVYRYFPTFTEADI